RSIFSWMNAWLRSGKRCTNGQFERGQGVVRGAESLDVLRLGGEQRALGVEKLERREPAEAVADGGDAIDFARLGKKLIADEDGLAQRRRRARERRLHGQTDLRADVAQIRRQLVLPRLRRRDLAAPVLPKGHG